MDIEAIREQALTAIHSAKSADELELLRVKYLGRKGIITDFLKQIASLPAEERRNQGKLANLAKQSFTELFENKAAEFKKILESTGPKKEIDLSLPGRKLWLGKKHPITQVLEEIIDILVGMGFTEKLGPEIETEWYNYTALNFPEDHPARDQIACFYLNDKELLRSHTSPVQIRVME
ncbi:MAG: phenylalanine--tRNA ligase subunit alpha, partial [Ignavibacteria bacterium]|nr:phenylalanine--tRNA ligase subunit alpha [Ignavibacteria bacterium]